MRPAALAAFLTSHKLILLFRQYFLVISLIALPILLQQGPTGARDLNGFWFWGIFAVVCWGVFFFKRAALLIYAQGQNALVLFADRPSAEEVRAFVRKLFTAPEQILAG